VDEANPPFMYKKGDRAAGLYPFIIRYIFQSLQIPVVISPMPWKRALRYADNGKIGIAGIYKNQERLSRYDYSHEIFQEKLAIFVHKELNLNFKSINDLKGRRVGVISGWSYGDDFDIYRRRNLFIVDEAQSDETNFHKLLKKRIDCAIAIEESGQGILANEIFSSKIVQLHRYVATNATFLIFPKSAHQTGLLSEFNLALSALKANYRHQELQDMFFSPTKFRQTGKSVSIP
jgi:polar amino acid transport system substrate-binding protein